MARPLWKGALAFGLVNIPVELHTAVRDSRPRFRLLHAHDKSPVKFERVCVREGKPVAWDALVKGYEYQKGRFVVLTKEDFRAAALEKTKTVDIRSFVKAEEIDDRFFESSYYLMPGKGGERSYALLREAIKQSGYVGIATIVLRDAQHLAAVEVVKQAMVLTLMRFAEELVDVSGFNFPRVEIRKPELQMARTLVEQLADTWKPDQYSDEYRANLMKIIKAKLKGKEAHLVEHAEPQQAEVVDLMERLRRSLEGSGGSGKRGGTPRAATTARAKKTAPRAAASKRKAPKTKRRRAA